MSRIRIGIAGTGFIAMYHLRAFLQIEEVEVAGMCTFSNMEKLHEICTKYAITPYRDINEMLEEGKLDGIVICSVTSSHFEEIRKAAKHHCHMLVEKPVVTELKQYEQINEWIQKSGTMIFPAHNFMYRESVKKMKELLEQKKIGTILYSSFMSTQLLEDAVKNSWRSKKEYARGGALLDSGHHLLYQQLYLLGSPEKLQAFQNNLFLSNMECEDIAQINMVMQDGSLSALMQSWSSKFGDSVNGIRILGTEGEIHLTDALYLNNEKICEAETYEDTFLNQAKAFLECLKGEGIPLSDLSDSENTLRITQAAYLSAQKNSVMILSGGTK